MVGFPLFLNLPPLYLLFSILCWFSAEKCEGAKILFYVSAGYSHRQSTEPLAHKLLENGHDVTFFSAEQAVKSNPKIREFYPPELKTFLQTTAKELFHNMFKIRAFSKYLHPFPSVLVNSYVEPDVCSLIFNSPDFQRWLKSSQFDLMIIDHSNQKCAFGLAYKFKAKVIAFSPTGFSSHDNEIWGWHSGSSWAPTFALSNLFSRERTFYDRLFLTIYPLFTHFVMNYIAIPIQDKITREKLKVPDMQSLSELEEQTRLLLVNQHPSSDYPRSFPPFVLPVGGMHCDVWEKQNQTQKKLPQKMAEFIDGAGDDGFIFISFGTIIIHMSQVPEDIINIFFEAVRGRKTRFLWKWDVDPPKNTPENIFTANWFPQQDLLAHPKIRGFITHGGMMSYQQSIANGVPLIVIPMVFDQPFNARHAQYQTEMGIHLEFSELTVEKLSGAIDSLLNDKTYHKNARIAQGRFLDRPQSPIDLALYWTEYVLSHNDTSHLKPNQAMAQCWWQRHLLDVWLFILILSSWAALKILQCIYRLLSKYNTRI